MDESTARALLAAERSRVEALLDSVDSAVIDDVAAAEAAGDHDDPAEPLTEEEGDRAVAEELRTRLAALERAEHRLDAGTYGRSVLSGSPIEDARLEADPAAELTAEEASRA
ncbi:MAG TPA: hypothetical protein VMD59_05540 [Acidimicrobiales bacterium]|nr:hypothetical protein [Acidimicrobiales bacterium]